MDVLAERIGKDQDERILVLCYEITDDIKNMVHAIKLINISLAGYIEDRVSQVPLQDIFFVEAVDNKVFAYTEKKVYEIKYKLCEFETLYESKRFFRCSKSFIVNLYKIDYVRPILNGRFSATLFNGEEVIISRQYVPELKKRLSGENI